jgi:hypothetical protein
MPGLVEMEMGAGPIDGMGLKNDSLAPPLNGNCFRVRMTGGW